MGDDSHILGHHKSMIRIQKEIDEEEMPTQEDLLADQDDEELEEMRKQIADGGGPIDDGNSDWEAEAAEDAVHDAEVDAEVEKLEELAEVVEEAQDMIQIEVGQLNVDMEKFKQKMEE